MSDQNKKEGEQDNKRKPEEDVTLLFLEASLNMAVAKLNILENQNTKSKVLDGVRNKVFLTHSDQQYKYYLGNFSIDKLEKEKLPINNDTRVGYRLYTGYVNWKNTWDISDIKETITSSTREINPFKNKSKAFRFKINDNESNNKIGSLKLFQFRGFPLQPSTLLSK